MLEIVRSDYFLRWLERLKDRAAVARIASRLDRAAQGNLGDVKLLRAGLWEMRIPHGPGYRVYFIRSGESVIVLLAGGDKSTQRKDIERAIDLAKAWRESQ